jgi:hypothetical protein
MCLCRKPFNAYLFSVALCLYRSATSALILVDMLFIVKLISNSGPGVPGPESSEPLSNESILSHNESAFRSSLSSDEHFSQTLSEKPVSFASPIPAVTEPSRISSSRFAPQLEHETDPLMMRPKDDSELTPWDHFFAALRKGSEVFATRVDGSMRPWLQIKRSVLSRHNALNVLPLSFPDDMASLRSTLDWVFAPSYFSRSASVKLR